MKIQVKYFQLVTTGDDAAAGDEDPVPKKRAPVARQPRVAQSERAVRVVRRVPISVRAGVWPATVAGLQQGLRLHAGGRGGRRLRVLHARRPQPGPAALGSDQPDQAAGRGAQERPYVRPVVGRPGRQPGGPRLAAERVPQQVVRVRGRSRGRVPRPVPVPASGQGPSGESAIIVSK